MNMDERRILLLNFLILVQLSLGQDIVSTITSTITDLFGGGGSGSGSGGSGGIGGINLTTTDDNLFGGITSTILCQSSTSKRMDSFGIDHNVALDATGLVLGEHPPDDLDGYILIVKDQAKSICDGEEICLAGLDTFTIEAMNYVYRQEEEHLDEFAIENPDVMKEIAEAIQADPGGKRRLTDVLPKNDLSDRVLEVLETVMVHISLNTEDEVVEALDNLTQEIQDEDHPERILQEDEKYLVNAAISVAKASTSYWKEAFSEDSNHFRRLQKGGLLNCAFTGEQVDQQRDIGTKPEKKGDGHHKKRGLRGEENKTLRMSEQKTPNSTGNRRTKYQKAKKGKKGKKSSKGYYFRGWDDYFNYYDDYYYSNYYGKNNYGSWYKSDPCMHCMNFYDCERCYQSNGYGAGSYNGGNGGYFNGGTSYSMNGNSMHGSYSNGGFVSGGSYGNHNFVNKGSKGFSHGGPVNNGFNNGMNNGRPSRGSGYYNGRPNRGSGYYNGRPNYYGGYYNAMGKGNKGLQKGYYNYYVRPNKEKGNWMDIDPEYYMQFLPSRPTNEENGEEVQQSFFEAVAGFGLNTFYVVRADVVGVIIGFIVGRGCVLPAAAAAFLFSALYAVCYRDPSIGFSGFFGN